MQIAALFIGLEESRVSEITTSIQKPCDITIQATSSDYPHRRLKALLEDMDVVFVNRNVKDSKLVQLLERIREYAPDVPIVLTYGSEPDGNAYLYSNKFDCWLFSEKDRLGRTLTAEDLAQGIVRQTSDRRLGKMLMELSLCAGPCSTGD